VTFKLIATLSHKSFGDPVVKELFYTAETKEDALARIQADAKAPDHLIHNLKHHGKCAFKDARGVKHSWKLELMENLN
jgi:hypothetical protein